MHSCCWFSQLPPQPQVTTNSNGNNNNNTIANVALVAISATKSTTQIDQWLQLYIALTLHFPAQSRRFSFNAFINTAASIVIVVVVSHSTSRTVTQ